MAAENIMNFDQEVVPSADAFGMYLANSGDVLTGFQHSFNTVPSVCPDVGLLVAGIGMAPSTFVMPEGALAAAGYGAVEAVPVEVPAPRQPRPVGADGEVVHFKGAWTTKEDNILKEMVKRYGDKKWAAIANHLPDRIGKQCRERWTNHLRPDLKKDIWTKDDDRVLIKSHKTHGNRWSAIARCLPGRSENAVKNHWNATRRSLMSKRRLKKKSSAQPVAPDQLTLLEEYILTQPPATVTEPTAQPLSSILGNYGGTSGIIPHQTAPDSNLPGMGMYVDMISAASMKLNIPVLHELDGFDAIETKDPCYYDTVPLGCRPSYSLNYGGGGLLPMTIDGGVTQDAYTNVDNLLPIPFAENLASDDVVADQLECQSYGRGYNGQGTCPSSDPDDIDVVEMAFREFFTPSEDEVTLDLTKFY